MTPGKVLIGSEKGGDVRLVRIQIGARVGQVTSLPFHSTGASQSMGILARFLTLRALLLTVLACFGLVSLHPHEHAAQFIRYPPNV